MNTLPNDITQARDLVSDWSDTAVVIPCLNEAASIGEVVVDFKTHLPGCRVIVFDNASTDQTAEVAAAHGAEVREEPTRGKGHVVRRMFRDIDADIFLLTDGDTTYDPSAAPRMIEKLRSDSLDVVIGLRVGGGRDEYRLGHQFGNRLLTGTIAFLFDAKLSDMLSGYRVMSRRFVKTLPIEAKGFEIETEITVHMLQLDAPFAEIETCYGSRPDNSTSKLRTYSDGFRILRAIIGLTALERPMSVLGWAGALAIFCGLGLFVPVFMEFQRTGLVERFPTLILALVLGLTGLASVFTGMILAGITRTRRDIKRLAYLQFDPITTKRGTVRGKLVEAGRENN